MTLARLSTALSIPAVVAGFIPATPNFGRRAIIIEVAGTSPAHDAAKMAVRQPDRRPYSNPTLPTGTLERRFLGGAAAKT